MSKGLIAFIAVAFIALVSAMLIFMKHTADVARKRSDEIMEQFKKVDRDFKEKNNKPDSLNKIEMEMDSLIKANK